MHGWEDLARRLHKVFILNRKRNKQEQNRIKQDITRSNEIKQDRTGFGRRERE